MRLLPLSGNFSPEGFVVAHRACFVAVERDFGLWVVLVAHRDASLTVERKVLSRKVCGRSAELISYRGAEILE